MEGGAGGGASELERLGCCQGRVGETAARQLLEPNSGRLHRGVCFQLILSTSVSFALLGVSALELTVEFTPSGVEARAWETSFFKKRL